MSMELNLVLNQTWLQTFLGVLYIRGSINPKKGSSNHSRTHGSFHNQEFDTH
jgi:hypothetical protein